MIAEQDGELAARISFLRSGSTGEIVFGPPPPLFAHPFSRHSKKPGRVFSPRVEDKPFFSRASPRERPSRFSASFSSLRTASWASPSHPHMPRSNNGRLFFFFPGLPGANPPPFFFL